MIFPWRFKISPKKTLEATHPPTSYSPFLRVAPPIARARYLTLCPEKLTSSTAEACPPFPERTRRWDSEVVYRSFRNGILVEKKHPREMGDENEKKALWKMSFRFVLGSWRSRSGVWSPLLACEAPSWTNWFVERGCIFPKPVDACLVKSVDLESQDLFYEWQGFGGYGDASPLLTGTTGTPSFTRDIRPNKKPSKITAVPSLTTDFFASTYRPIQLPASPATQQRLVGWEIYLQRNRRVRAPEWFPIKPQPSEPDAVARATKDLGPAKHITGDLKVMLRKK